MHLPSQIHFSLELRQFRINLEIFVLECKNLFLQNKNQLDQLSVVRFLNDPSDLCQCIEGIDRHDGISVHHFPSACRSLLLGFPGVRVE